VFGKHLKWQNIFLLISSYIFYGWWDWRFLSLLLITTLSDFIAGKLIEDKPMYKKWVLTWVIFLNIGILFYFKYANFFVEGFANLIGLIGIELGYITKRIILPVGISFYTFQSISYILDVYKGKVQACRDLLNYSCFIAFFPQLVAGPIERVNKLLPQIENQRNFDFSKSSLASQLILWGLFKKIFIADNCGLLVDEIFEKQELYGLAMHWFGVGAFAIQIYCDFSGYSEIAIGISLLLGFELMQNFNYPYLTSNIKDFWKTWHISLTSWFKDYVYIPLGGSSSKLYRNVLIVFLLSGLWHGANFTFISWGLYHAVCYLIYINFFESRTKYPLFISWLMNMIAVLIGWVFFRAENMSDAVQYIKNMFDFRYLFQGFSLDFKILSGVSLLFIFEIINRKKMYAFDLSSLTSRSMRWFIYLIIIILILAYGQFGGKSFIYFNF
jgi:D-alanyl-lipoteichoic acid acyltransferase DltB (MBOAT superfamily)